jgi:glycosyltransferase involved in cell wall biosynthesis
MRQEAPFFLRPVVKAVLNRMRSWDLRGAKRIDYFIANSMEVQARIRTIYGADSTLIHPCIRAEFWKPTAAKKDYFLLAGRLQAHKSNEIIIKAFNKMGLPLHVAGSGRQEKYLRSIAKSNIVFFGRVSDEVLRDEYSGALGYIFPQVEDFGLMPLEAAACGTATLAYGKGGALETVTAGQTGEFFNSLNMNEIIEMVKNWKSEKYPPQVLINKAGEFSVSRFKQEIFDFINSR